MLNGVSCVYNITCSSRSVVFFRCSLLCASPRSPPHTYTNARARTSRYHPCLASDLKRQLLYSPALGLLIREPPQLPDVLTAALLALFTESVLKVAVIFFFVAGISGSLIWCCERHKKGIFPYAKVFPVRYIDGIDAGFYWALTTGTSTGYGDKYPVTAGGRVWAM